MRILKEIDDLNYDIDFIFTKKNNSLSVNLTLIIQILGGLNIIENSSLFYYFNIFLSIFGFKFNFLSNKINMSNDKCMKYIYLKRII